MSSWPVLLREMRLESRHAANYWLRVAAGLTVSGALIYTLLDVWQEPSVLSSSSFRQSQVTEDVIGVVLFGRLNVTLFCAIWILVPLLTADCISRERREGTLGLLFLTPLTAMGILAGKSCVHGLRALTLFLTMLPLLAVALLFGGLSFKDLLMAVLVDTGALILALGAGLLASSCCRERMRSIVLAEVLGVALAVGFILLHLWLVLSLYQLTPWQLSLRGVGNGGGFIRQCGQALAFSTNLSSGLDRVWLGTGTFGVIASSPWREIWSKVPVAEHGTWFEMMSFWLGGALMLSFGAMRLGVWRIRHSWKDAPPSAEREELERKFCQPRLWRGLLRRRMSRMLERNPVGWLQHYSWRARLSKWMWCLFMILVECAASMNMYDAFLIQQWLGMVLLLGVAFSAAVSFRAERETGALELMLVSPLRVAGIMHGRVRGIWTQYLPCVLLIGSCWLFLQLDYDALVWVAGMVCWYLTLPLIGLYFSLLRLSVLSAWLCTCALGLGLPILVGLFMESRHPGMIWAGVLMPNVMVMGWAGWRVHRRLTERRFEYQ